MKTSAVQSARVLQFPAPAPAATSSLDSRAPGVWETDAADGYVGLVAYDAQRRLAIRVDVRADVYSRAFVDMLQRCLP